VPTSFYFKPGSLPLRRFQRANHLAETAAFGPRLAGKAPEVGDLPLEPAAEAVPRDSWARADQRGESSLERHPESELYCLIKEGDRWTFPSTAVAKGEGLDEAVKRSLLSKEGLGENMDSWIVARNPIGAVQNVGP
jgi:large subunit ribosomal protein L46